MKKKIIILIVAILIVVIGYYVRSLILKKRAYDAMTKEEKALEAMREKYKDINSLDEFNQGVKYVKYPSIFGYDLRLLKEIKPNALSLITLDELKFIYEMSKVGTSGQSSNSNDMKFLDIMHKMF